MVPSWPRVSRPTFRLFELVPGQTYALEPIVVRANMAVFGATLERYPGKYLAWGGIEESDLVFRTGIGLEIVPEPLATLLIGLSLAVVFPFGLCRPAAKSC